MGAVGDAAVSTGNLHPPRPAEWERCQRCGEPMHPPTGGDACRCGMRRVGQRGSAAAGSPELAALVEKATEHMKLDEDEPL